MWRSDRTLWPRRNGKHLPMGCRTFQKRTGSTTTSTAPTGKMTGTCASTLGKGRSYRRASDRWGTSFLLRGGRALPGGSWYVEANFSFCAIACCDTFVVVLFSGSWVQRGAVSHHWQRWTERKIRWCIGADVINKCGKVGRAFHRLAVRLSRQTNGVSVIARPPFVL